MTNEICIKHFKKSCIDNEVRQKTALKVKWGKISPGVYWVGKKSNTMKAHCVWCARSIAMNRGIIME